MKKQLVAYFSATGKTKSIALQISEVLNADLYEIKPSEAYTNGDLNWMNKNSRSSIEMKNKIHPTLLENHKANIEAYDEIILGFPIWWYIAPTIINSFLESHTFKNKKIILFATSGGSNFGNTVKELIPSCSDATIIEGKVFNNVNKNDIESWAKSLKK